MDIDNCTNLRVVNLAKLWLSAFAEIIDTFGYNRCHLLTAGIMKPLQGFPDQTSVILMRGWDAIPGILVVIPRDIAPVTLFPDSVVKVCAAVEVSTCFVSFVHFLSAFVRADEFPGRSI